MKTTADFLDALRVKLELPSDGQLADHLGLHRQYISRYRRLATSFDDEMSMKVAGLLDIDPAYVVACMHYQRTKHEAEKKLWERIANLSTGIAAALAILAILPYNPGHFEGSTAFLAAFAAPQQGGLYIMSNPPYITWAVLIAFACLWSRKKTR